MSVRTVGAGAVRSRGFEGATPCEAFQLTAAQFADETALRTVGGAVELSWADYAERVTLLR